MTPKEAISYIEPSIEHLREDASHESGPTREEIARLAIQLWEDDDHPTSSPEHYWAEAERRLRRGSVMASR
jgi:hypothetical protein